MRRALTLLAAAIAIVMLAACAAAATPFPTDTPGPPTLPPTPRVTPEPTLPPDLSTPADTPSREEAYQQLIVSVPPDIAPKCKAAPKSEELDPGELAQADCDLPNGALADYVDYKLFIDAGSMNAYFDTQRKGHEKGGTATGPGCGKGPGEGTWDAGRKDCFLFVTNDAQVMWTHDFLYIEASAFRDDGDFAKLEEFWTTAGPLAP